MHVHRAAACLFTRQGSAAVDLTREVARILEDREDLP